MADDSLIPTQPEPATAADYVVVARRYRPQTFADLVGQEHVTQALSNAIATNRVGHAYLFTGARGVGKTSAARIFAKALNCQRGPTPVPCNACDVCQSVSLGEDVDVLEIDGASNRGIDEIRQLRQNVGVRPSRTRFKIYIIDEVHMLTVPAFNALLKTLEEPPEHVKFIFCTTEAGKIPITILSRCQRFDFAGIQTSSIVGRLRQIVEAEGAAVEPEVLETLARRAGGSMRDSQSLLEQLLAFAPGRITLADVHAMLGTAGDEWIEGMVNHLVGRDPAAALVELDKALAAGADPGLLLEQLLGYFRDAMLAAVGCPADQMLYVSAQGRSQVATAGRRMGLSAILAAMQILDQALARMRTSTQGRILAEMALVRIAHLEDLEELADLIAQVRGGTAGIGASPSRVQPPDAKKNDSLSPVRLTPEPLPAQARPTDGENSAGVPNAENAAPQPLSAPAAASREMLSAASAAGLWAKAVGRLSGIAADAAREFDDVTLVAPQRLRVTLRPGYAFAKSFCEQPEQVAKFQQALADVTGQRITLEFTVVAAGEEPRPGSSVSPPPPRDRLAEVRQHPLIRRAAELFGAEPLRVDNPPAGKRPDVPASSKPV